MTLANNYPNPFNPNTVIEFSLPKAADIKLAVYNLRGERVKMLRSGQTAAGVHQAVWDGTDMAGLQAPSGVYFYRLQTEDQDVIKQMLLMR